MSRIADWAVTVVTLVSILLAVILSINFAAELRSITTQGVPRPWLVMYRRTLGRFLPGRTDPIETLVGRTAFLSWDIRWVTAGETLAKVIAVDEIGNGLMLQLEKPIVLHATEIAPELCLERVQFKPGRILPILYGKQAVSGHLFPCISEDLFASASVVVYPSEV